MAIVGITGGVDTHADVHVTAAVDHNGGLLDVQPFPADQTGYESLLGWLCGFDPVVRIGVEGTGSWGVGLTRFLTGQDVEVVEVDRSNRQTRRKKGKSDPTDAISAARAALSGEASVVPKTRDGAVEQIRVLLVARRSAREQRIQSLTPAASRSVLRSRRNQNSVQEQIQDGTGQRSSSNATPPPLGPPHIYDKPGDQESGQTSETTKRGGRRDR